MSDYGYIKADQTFPPQRVPLVGLEEGPSGRGRPDAVHLPALNPSRAPLAAARQTSPRRARGPRRQHYGGRDSTFLEINGVSEHWGGAGE